MYYFQIIRKFVEQGIEDYFFVLSKDGNSASFVGGEDLESLKKEINASLDYPGYDWYGSNAIFYIQYRPIIAGFESFEEMRKFIENEKHIWEIGDAYALRIKRIAIDIINRKTKFEYVPYKQC